MTRYPLPPDAVILISSELDYYLKSTPAETKLYVNVYKDNKQRPDGTWYGGVHTTRRALARAKPVKPPAYRIVVRKKP